MTRSPWPGRGPFRKPFMRAREASCLAARCSSFCTTEAGTVTLITLRQRSCSCTETCSWDPSIVIPSWGRGRRDSEAQECERGDSNPHGTGPRDPKSRASTNSATFARIGKISPWRRRVQSSRTSYESRGRRRPLAAPVPVGAILPATAAFSRSPRARLASDEGSGGRRSLPRPGRRARHGHRRAT